MLQTSQSFINPLAKMSSKRKYNSASKRAEKQRKIEATRSNITKIATIFTQQIQKKAERYLRPIYTDVNFRMSF